MFSPRHVYTVVEKDDFGDRSETVSAASNGTSWRDMQITSRHFLIILATQFLLWISSLGVLYSVMRPNSGCSYFPLDRQYHDASGNSYPAAEAIKYETVIFGEDKSYMSSVNGSLPSPEVDKRWTDLQEPIEGMIQASVQEGFDIDHLPITNISTIDPRFRVYGLEVFHQLHCLNRLRMSFHAGHYFPNETQEQIIWHREHCLDHLRQGVLCSGDVAMDRWEYDAEAKKSWLKTDVPHVCRNFQSLSDWVVRYRWQPKDWLSFNTTEPVQPVSRRP